MRLESHGAIFTHTPSLYEIGKNEIKNEGIDRGDYTQIPINIKSGYNLLFLCAKICFMYKNMERRGVKI